MKRKGLSLEEKDMALKFEGKLMELSLRKNRTHKKLCVHVIWNALGLSLGKIKELEWSYQWLANTLKLILTVREKNSSDELWQKVCKNVEEFETCEKIKEVSKR